MIDYDFTQAVTESQATELRERAAEYQGLVEVWITKNHPKYKP